MNDVPGKRADPGLRQVKTAGFSYLVEPKPAWVATVKPDIGTRFPDAAIYYELVDDQMRVGADGQADFHHSIRVVNQPSGLTSAAQIQAEFDPSFQTLVFHDLSIWRGGRLINKLGKKKIQLLRRETQLERLSYNGQVTASIVLDDVRVGDKIEYAYTIRGANPVFEGKLAYGAWIPAQLGPEARYQFRLLAPAGRTINYRAPPEIKVSSSVRDGVRETLFQQSSIPQFQFDENAPESVLYLSNQVQVSEFPDWKSVASWGVKLFAPAQIPSQSVQKQAGLIRAAAKSPGERVAAALDFVQNDIRYFGVEIGANTHRPSPPETIISQRYGDCKDKVALLIALLSALDIQASPVIVSTHFGHELDEAVLPSPFAFDHAIAHVEVDGKTLWLDGTRSHQTGSLEQRQATGLGSGLVLESGSEKLTELPSADSQDRMDVEETVRIKDFAETPVLMESRVTFFGDLAEGIRNAIATKPADELRDKFNEGMLFFYPKTRVTSPARFEEVPDQNAITMVQQFSFPEFWQFPDERVLTRKIVFWNIAGALHLPDTPERTRPFKINYPGVYKYNLTIEYPEDIVRTASSAHFDDGDANFEYHVKYDSELRRTLMNAELRLTEGWVSASDWPAYQDKINKIRPRLAGYPTVMAMTLSQSDQMKEDLTAFTKDLNRGSIKVATAVQLKAKINQMLLTANLKSGRLSPVLRAQALAERGTDLDMTGDPQKGGVDFEEAMRLDPDNEKIIGGAAVNAFLQGNDARAAELDDKAQALKPTRSGLYRIYIDYYLHKYDAAKAGSIKTLKAHSDVENNYAAIWLYLSARRSGEDGVAAIKPYMREKSTSGWPYPLVKMLYGSGDYESALKAAKTDPKDPSNLCELYFYMGEKYALDGDYARAREFYQKSIDTRVVEYNEYVMSKRGLKALE